MYLMIDSRKEVMSGAQVMKSTIVIIRVETVAYALGVPTVRITWVGSSFCLLSNATRR